MRELAVGRIIEKTVLTPRLHEIPRMRFVAR